jgi:hypothetical protein
MFLLNVLVAFSPIFTLTKAAFTTLCGLLMSTYPTSTTPSSVFARDGHYHPRLTWKLSVSDIVQVLNAYGKERVETSSSHEASTQSRGIPQHNYQLVCEFFKRCITSGHHDLSPPQLCEIITYFIQSMIDIGIQDYQNVTEALIKACLDCLPSDFWEKEGEELPDLYLRLSMEYSCMFGLFQELPGFSI